MTLDDHIEKIKSRCREVLELDAKFSLVSGIKGITLCGRSYLLTPCGTNLDLPIEGAVESIGARAVFTPSAARAVLVGIEALVRIAFVDPFERDMSYVGVIAHDALRAIAEQFPIEDGE